MSEATVSRLDIAQNFIVKNPVQVYYNHFGELKHGKRLPITDDTGMVEGMYYYQSNGVLAFYDKVKEQKAKGQPIPDVYTGRHTLRYEQRYRKRLPATFGVERVTGAMLYDEAFYINVVNRWQESYKAIKKINDVTLNFEAMTTKKDLYKMGLLSLIEVSGGELGIISQINEAQQCGDLTKKQAFDLRKAVKEACKVKDGLTVKNEAILELDKKVNEAAKFYR
ncbi:hypothetical protein EZS27_028196 [termite gut metagenome]|uniref:Replication-associated protein G2P N-terminal domain-containing protein n=1 Tax=termite gut metagenome TaxID=433724 RepID=A0A5J4QJU6_9ZZZZ